MSLRNRLLLVSCHIKLWGNTKEDPMVEHGVAQAHGVKKGKAGSWKTNLLAGADAEYESLAQTTRFCRSYHYKTTLRWGKRGEQALPSEMFLDYSKNMLQYRALADQRLADLLEVWDERVEQAKANSPLAQKFSFPSKEQLRARCSIQIEIGPMPQAGDLVLDIEDKEAQDLLQEERDRLQELEDERVKDAMKDLWERLEGILTQAHRNLAVSSEGRFHDSWWENLEEFAQIGEKLNFTKSKEFSESLKEAKGLLRASQDEYREDLQLRERGEAEVEALLEKMKGYFG